MVIRYHLDDNSLLSDKHTKNDEESDIENDELKTDELIGDDTPTQPKNDDDETNPSTEEQEQIQMLLAKVESLKSNPKFKQGIMDKLKFKDDNQILSKHILDEIINPTTSNGVNFKQENSNAISLALRYEKFTL